MKKLILLLVLATAFLSCSKSDDNKELPVTYGNISGVWYLSQYIKMDGTVVNHVHKCATLKDNMNFVVNILNIDVKKYYANCVSVDDSDSSFNFYLENNIIKNGNSFIDNCTIVSLTKDKMVLNYSEPHIMINQYYKTMIVTRN
ncbi:hypothetical protein B0A58_11950 [Flavobacterium branchiophilum NBRC 15030 = ATCC 35035]|uniref:Lipocalin-like domain-containing protein n=1 Tax=Flavobacterium branchiophilum TaxID=55197 RepID=A0A543G4H9_9FLAO|nr:hypothetical protein [Flavobacterium branchiophilum]OXA73156.1 hypothetical protein B0A58_11950 [Flavobacterium branchiophilum NBRC 15030 = ATCC 35035]TQM40945.1 hypothetical protein BC670_1869 [Flavobacterium branchiophilum]GEM54758.1 hypothetical protein FB1_09790 [Flavobacterium branchiophilum NBRC 15030 = ATCC 35035]